MIFAIHASAFLLFLSFAFPALSHAAYPLDLEDTATEGKGNYSAELTAEYVKWTSFTSSAAALTVTAGAAERIDISIQAPYLQLDPNPDTKRREQGPGDVIVALKHRIYEDSDSWTRKRRKQRKKDGLRHHVAENSGKRSLGYELYAELPTGNSEKGLGTGTTGLGGIIMGTEEWERVRIHLNAGYASHGSALNRGEVTPAYVAFYGIAAEYRISAPFWFVSELYEEKRAEAGVFSRPLVVLGGVIYELSDAWYVDAGVRAGLNIDAEAYTVRAGIGYIF